VAIIGARHADPAAAKFSHELAQSIARAGAVVVSGGALGIDAAAHRGALEANGRTWVVAGTGHAHCYPPEHDRLFETIARGPGAMVWPFGANHRHRSAFRIRNRVLAALADAVIVIQAGAQSGALHTSAWARRLAKPLWVVPAAPWAGDDFAGSRKLLDEGVRPLASVERLLSVLPLAAEVAQARTTEPPLNFESSIYINILRSMSKVPLHIDEIAARVDSPVKAIAAALLTLALENVVVEGPPGFFRRLNTGNH
jgi:DNA processing protein